MPPLCLRLILDDLAGHLSYRGGWAGSLSLGSCLSPRRSAAPGGTGPESVPRLLKRRARERSHPGRPAEIIALLEADAAGWNREPTPLEWGVAVRNADEVSGCAAKGRAALWAHAPFVRRTDVRPALTNGNNSATGPAVTIPA